MIDRDSRYGTCVLIRDGQGEALGTRRRIAAPRRNDDRFHTVIAGDRIDLLAWRYMGDARLWWIIADYNDIFFPLELEPGALLRIPSVEQVLLMGLR